MATIVLENVVRAYGAVRALDGVNLTIEDGSFTSVFGRPGSGKSVLLRVLLGLEPVDGGRILIDGRDMTNAPPTERGLAMVFQNLALFPHLTAWENIAFPLKRRGASAATMDERIARVGDVLGIDHILHKKPGALSGGERQRVAIGRALVREAGAYLMDEPIAALDARLRDTMRVELKRLQTEEGHTFVYVTHDNEEAMSVADRLAILDRGRVVQVDEPDAVYAAPGSLAIAELVGSPRVNVIDARIENGHLTTPVATIPVGGPSRTVSVAVRPEAIRLTDAGGYGEAVPMSVSDVERLGGFSILSLEGREGFRLRAVTTGDTPIERGHTVGVNVRPADMMLFDGDGRPVPSPMVASSLVPVADTSL